MTHLVPPRPNLVPPAGTTSPERPRPSSPSPTGDEVAQSRPDEHTNHPHTTPTRDDLRDDLNRKDSRP